MKKFKPNSDVMLLKSILERNELTRDKKDIAYTLYLTEKGYNVYSMNVSDLLSEIKERKLLSPDTVARRVRDIQYHFPDLRGKEYPKRQRFTKNVKEDKLGYPDDSFIDPELPGATP